MADFLYTTVVNYLCSCGLLNPLTKCYFCRHCLKLRCGFCVSHEVDSQFCSNCLENIPSSEAKLKKNRCNSCFDCPSCHHTLSARASSVTVPMMKKGEDGKEVADGTKTVTKKMYYLACLGCRWTSREVGIPDQSVATGSWPDLEYENSIRYGLLLEYYQALVMREKQEKLDYSRRKIPRPTGKYQSLTDRTGLTVSMIRRQMGWSDKQIPHKIKMKEINPSVSEDDILDDLPIDLFTKELELCNITTVEQRLGQPAFQPNIVANLMPMHKKLCTKLSLRCRQCEHNVIKSEYNPASIKYRIQLFASYHVPEVQLQKKKDFKSGEKAVITLKIMNPTMHNMTITLGELQVDPEIVESQKDDSIVSEKSITALSCAFSRQTSLNEEPRTMKEKPTATIEIPQGSFTVHNRDDSAEFDDDFQQLSQQVADEPSFVTYRKANQVGITFSIIPNEDLNEGDNVYFGLRLNYTYANTTINPPNLDRGDHSMEAQIRELAINIFVNAGQIVA